MIKACLLMFVGILGIVACGGNETPTSQPVVQASDNTETQAQDIRFTSDLEAKIKQIIRNEFTLMTSATAVTATSTGFLPMQMRFELIEVINSVMKESEAEVSRLAAQISDNAYSFDEFAYHLAGKLNDVEYEVTRLEDGISNLTDQIACMVAEIDRAERLEDIDYTRC
jgi:hypothetical protein